MSRESYEATTAPRRRREPSGLWTFIDLAELRDLREAAGAVARIDEAEPIEQPLRSVNRCSICPAEGVGMILHPNPETVIPDGRRTICGPCQGKANSRRAGVGHDARGGRT